MPVRKRKLGKIQSIIVSVKYTKRQAMSKIRDIADKAVIEYGKTKNYHHFVLRQKGRFKNIGTKVITPEIKMRYGKLNPCRPTSSNPVFNQRQISQATKLFGDFHGFETDQVKTMTIERQIPKVLVQVGHLREVVYFSDKDSQGRPKRYLHDFKEPYPILCTNHAGKGLFILGGHFKVKKSGIVN